MLLLQGCAALVVEPEPAPPRGGLRSLAGQPGLVIGSPYGGPDDLSDQISLELARQTGFGLVVAADLPRDRGGLEEAYRLHVREVARGPLRLYVEIHGGQGAAKRIEIVTVGVNRDEAWRLRTLFELIRDAHLRARHELPRLDVLVRPAESNAAAAAGVALHAPERAFRIGLPRAIRTPGYQVYTAILAEFLTESSRLLLTRGK